MKLSPRQKQIAELIADGSTLPEIAVRLGVLEGTIRTQVARILKKKRLKRTADIAPFMLRRRLERNNLYIKDTQAAT